MDGHTEEHDLHFHTVVLTKLYSMCDQYITHGTESLSMRSLVIACGLSDVYVFHEFHQIDGDLLALCLTEFLRQARCGS